MHKLNREQVEKQEEYDRLNVASTTVRVDGKWKVVQVCGVNKKRNYKHIKCDAEDIDGSSL